MIEPYGITYRPGQEKKTSSIPSHRLRVVAVTTIENISIHRCHNHIALFERVIGDR